VFIRGRRLWDSDDRAEARPSRRPIVKVITQWHLQPVPRRVTTGKCQPMTRPDFGTASRLAPFTARLRLSSVGVDVWTKRYEERE